MRRARPRPCGARWKYSIPCTYVQVFYRRGFWVCVPNTNSRGCASPFRGFATPTNKKPHRTVPSQIQRAVVRGGGGDDQGLRCAQSSRYARTRTAEAAPRRFAASHALRAKFSLCSNTNSRGCASPFRGFATPTNKKPTLTGGFFVGGAESRKNAHRIISDKQNGILLPSRFVAIRLSAIRQTISCNKYTE